MAAWARRLPIDSASCATVVPSATSRTLPSGNLIAAIRHSVQSSAGPLVLRPPKAIRKNKNTRPVSRAYLLIYQNKADYHPAAKPVVVVVLALFRLRFM